MDQAVANINVRNAASDTPQKVEVFMKLSKAEIAALQYLSAHRGAAVRAGDGHPISTVIFNRLERKLLVMWSNEKRRTVIMTANGERFLKTL
jgi:hypothetical protein